MSRHRRQAPPGSAGHSGGRGIVLDVTPELINAAVVRDSSHCVIADALRSAVPDARAISVDLQTIRFTDPANGRRYVYLTPAPAQVVLVKFDQGIKPEPFKLRLGKPAQITRSGAGHKHADGSAPDPNRKTVTNTHGTPTIIGGRVPPTAALTNTVHRGKRRTFGLRELRP